MNTGEGGRTGIVGSATSVPDRARRAGAEPLRSFAPSRTAR